MTWRIQQLFSLIMLTSILFLMTNAFANTTQPAFNAVVILGDSLSDNGNLYSGNLPWWLPIPAKFLPKPPYYEGRFSNGPVWTDVIANLFQNDGIKIVNYAVGGSLINKHFGLYLPYTLGDAIEHYFEIEQPSQTEITNNLYVVFIGVNDYLQGLQYFSDTDADTTYAINTLSENIERLIAEKANKLVIMNLPDISKTPYNTNPEQQAILHELIMLHNQKLASLIEALRTKHPGIKLEFFDTHVLFEELLADPIKFNEKYHTQLRITEKAKSCWTGGYWLQQSPLEAEKHIQTQLESHQEAGISALYMDNQAIAHDIYTSPSLYETFNVSYRNGVICDAPDQYIFWDKVHPSKAIHEAIANIIFHDLKTYWENYRNS